MATIIDELMISLGIDGNAAKKGMQDVTSSIQGGVSKITGMLGGLTAAFAGVFAVGSAFSDYLNSADAMAKFSRSIGANIEDVHAWSEAVIRSGGSAEGFQGSVKSLTTQLSKMATLGKSKAGNVLSAVGIDPGEVGRQRDAFDVLMDISDKMQEMSAAEATGFGQSLGLDVGTINLLREGRDGVKDLIRHQKELGVYDEATAKAAEDFNDAMADTKQAFTVLVASIGSSVLPALKTLLQYVSQFVAYLKQHQAAIKAFFIMIGTLITAYLIPIFLAFARSLLMNPLTWVILALVGLALAIEDLIVWMEGGESALDDFWEALFGDRENAKRIFTELKERLMKFWEGLKFVFNYIVSGKAWQALKDNANTAIQRIKDRWQIFMRDMRDKWERFKRDVKAPFEKMGEAINNLKARWAAFTADIESRWNNAINAISGAWQWVQSTISAAWQELNNTIADVLNWIQTKAAEVWQWIRDKCQEALNWVIQKWNEFKAAALGALNSLFGPINAIADSIRNTIGSAIDWAITKWQNLKAMVSAGDVYSQSDMSYLGLSSGAGSTTNNNSSSFNINGPITVKANNPYEFKAKAWNAAGYTAQANSGGM